MKARFLAIAVAAAAAAAGAGAGSILAGCSLFGDDKPRGCDFKGQHHDPGEVFEYQCNTCRCDPVQGVSCTEIACGLAIDAMPGSCAPDPLCPEGPSCGPECCNPGEHCEDGVCKCGDHAGCVAGDQCAAAGPQGGDACGSICCGTSGPCPQ